MVKKLIFLVIIFSSQILMGQWSDKSQNPLIIKDGYSQFDPEVAFSGEQFFFIWAEAVGIPSSKRKVKTYDKQGYFNWFQTKPIDTRDKQITNNSINWRNLWPDNDNGIVLTQLMQGIESRDYYIRLTSIDMNGNIAWSTDNILERENWDAEHFWLDINDSNEIFLAIESSGSAEEIDLSIYMINPNGSLGWEKQTLFLGDSARGINRDVYLEATEDGGCFYSFVQFGKETYENGYSFTESTLTTNRLDEWGQEVVIGGLTQYADNYNIGDAYCIHDKDDNLYSIRKSNGYRIQKFDPQLEPLWNSEEIRLIRPYLYKKPLLIEIGEVGDVRIFFEWIEKDRIQVLGQSVSSGGELNWDDNGQKLLEIPNGMFVGNFKICSLHDTTLIAYQQMDPQDSTNYQIAYKVFDQFGDSINEFQELLHDSEDHNQYVVSVNSDKESQFVITWIQYTGRNSILMAQNIHLDGSFGIKTSIYNAELEENVPFAFFDPNTKYLIFEQLHQGILTRKFFISRV